MKKLFIAILFAVSLFSIAAARADSIPIAKIYDRHNPHTGWSEAENNNPDSKKDIN